MKNLPLFSVVAVLCLTGITSALAAVDIRPASGGVTISADTAADSSTPVWTSLGSIEIAEFGDSRGDISTGTLILRIPAGFELNTNVTPSIRLPSTQNKDVFSADIAITDSQTLTVTLVVTGSAYVDRVTIGSNPALQVRPLTGASLTNVVHIYRPIDGGTAVIAGVEPSADGTTGTSFGPLGIAGGLATQIGFVQQPGNAEVGLPFGQQPVIQTKDQYGNRTALGLPETLEVVTELVSGSGILLGSVTNDIGSLSGNGIITHSNLQINSAGEKQISVTAAAFATATSELFSVSKGNQVVTLSDLSAKTYGDAAFVVSAASSSGLPVNLGLSSGPATLIDGTVTITGAGEIVLVGSAVGNDDWNSAETNLVIGVLPAALIATAANVSRVVGASNPALTGNLSGVVNGDNILAFFTCAADENSAAGNYPIVPSLNDPDSRLSNYSVTLVNGTLSVTPLVIRPTLRLALSNAVPVLSISGEPAHVYAIESSETVDGIWQGLTNVVTDAAGLLDHVDNDGTNQTRFYRLVSE